MEHGERASFTFAADESRLPLTEASGALKAANIAAGDHLELDVTLVHVLRQKARATAHRTTAQRTAQRPPNNRSANRSALAA